MLDPNVVQKFIHEKPSLARDLANYVRDRHELIATDYPFAETMSEALGIKTQEVPDLSQPRAIFGAKVLTSASVKFLEKHIRHHPEQAFNDLFICHGALNCLIENGKRIQLEEQETVGLVLFRYTEQEDVGTGESYLMIDMELDFLHVNVNGGTWNKGDVRIQSGTHLSTAFDLYVPTTLPLGRRSIEYNDGACVRELQVIRRPNDVILPVIMTTGTRLELVLNDLEKAFIQMATVGLV